MTDVYLLFNNTRLIIQAERFLKDTSFSYQVRPVPREVSSECGMAILVKLEDMLGIESLFCEKEIVFKKWQRNPSFDLMSLVEEGGCSSKLSASSLKEVMSNITQSKHPRLIVGATDCDDAGVYLLNDEQALIETTDFFPPVCSDPYTFGQIAATNAMSDVYAMGGEVLTAMNIALFPASGVPMYVLSEILKGGQDKVSEAGGLIVGGHTLTDPIPKYGLAVTGLVHPRRLITNAAAKVGDVLVLTKPLGTGILQSARKLGIVSEVDYSASLSAMRLLNRAGAKVMQEFSLRAATDVTGFGLLGHALHMARGSGVSLKIYASDVPIFRGVLELAASGCLPGGIFRNEKYVAYETCYESDVSLDLRMILADPQTSGGLLMAVQEKDVKQIVARLIEEGYESASAIGMVCEYHKNSMTIA